MVLGVANDTEASITQLRDALGEALDRVIHDGLTLRDATCAAEVVYQLSVLGAQAAKVELSLTVVDVVNFTGQNSISYKLGRPSAA